MSRSTSRSLVAKAACACRFGVQMSRDVVKVGLGFRGIRLSEQMGVIHTARAETELFAQGSAPCDVYLIHEGIVKVLWADAHGHEVIIGLRSPGRLLGSSPAIVGQAHPVTAVTLTRCVLERIGVLQFTELLTANTEFSLRVHRSH